MTERNQGKSPTRPTIISRDFKPEIINAIDDLVSLGVFRSRDKAIAKLAEEQLEILLQNPQLIEAIRILHQARELIGKNQDTV